MLRVKQITDYIENFAPLALQESYDNAGLITGSSAMEVSGVLISLDCTEAVIEEAIRLGCNLIIAHHPIVFKGLKKLNGKNYVERTVIKAIKNDIAIYAAHTNLDNVRKGVNAKIAEKIGLQNLRILLPKAQLLKKLITFVPKANTDTVLAALYEAGAGHIGNYDQCSFTTEGMGSFRGSADTNPHIGKPLVQENVHENRIEIILPAYLEAGVLRALKDAHPYEEVAYYLTTLDNTWQDTGAGLIGELPQEMEEMEFLQSLKQKMQLSVVRHTPLLGRKVRKVAVCGGAGSFLVQQAIGQGADIFVSADFKYHEFFDADGQLIIADIGHYESEVFTKDLFYAFLYKKFSNIAFNISTTVTNPVSYL